MPHLNIDPIVCISNIVMALQTIISRNTNPFSPTVFSVNSIKGGSEENLVVDKAQISIRSLDSKSLKNAQNNMEDLSQNIAKVYGCKISIEYDDRIPIVYNSKNMYEKALKSAQKVVGKDNTIRLWQVKTLLFSCKKSHHLNTYFQVGKVLLKKKPSIARNFSHLTKP